MNSSVNAPLHSFKRGLTVLALLALAACGLFKPSDPSNLSIGTVIDDKSINLLAKNQIDRASPELSDAHVGVTSYNGIVLLTGQVPSVDLKQKAQDALSDIRKIRRVHNELEIAGPTSIIARGNDATLTTTVKAKLIADANVAADHIKVVTENSVVYLMGLVTKAESEAAIEIARNVYGVQRVVTVFEFLP